MEPEYILLLLYFSGRLFFYNINCLFKEERNTFGFCKRLLWGLIVFLFSPELPEALLLFAIYTAMLTAEYFLQPKGINKAGSYYSVHMLLAFVFWLLVIKLFLPILPEILNPLNYLRINLESLFFPEALFKPEAFIEILLGYILVLKEGTIVIRLVLSKIKAEPASEPVPKEPDTDEYERGRIIGILERSFYYFLILSNNLGGVAVIIALKSLARFKKLDQKEFAEYFLIGSLLSLAAAAIPAVIIQLLL